MSERLSSSHNEENDLHVNLNIFVVVWLIAIVEDEKKNLLVC